MTAIIGWAPIVAPWTDRTLAAVEPLVPAAQFAAIMCFRRWQDRQARLAARLILRRILALRRRSASLDDLAVTTQGRPFIPRGGDFSMAHTTTLALCAWVAQGRIGIDVETPRPGVTLDDFLSWMSEAEHRRLAASPDPLTAALLLWTAKEAVCKAEGCGIASGALPDCAAPLVAFRDKVWDVRSRLRRGHAISIARTSGQPQQWRSFRYDVGDEASTRRTPPFARD